MGSKKAHNQQTTLDAFWYKLDRIILPEFGSIDAMKMTQRRMDQFVKKRLNGYWVKLPDERYYLKPVKRTTVHRDVTMIIAILNWCVDRGYLEWNPLHKYKKPKRDDEVITPVTRDEAEAILSHSPPHLVRALMISYYTGLRPGFSELLILEWSAVDFRDDTITVISAKKNGPKVRIIPLHPDFKALLVEWHAEDAGNHPYIIHYNRSQKRLKGQPIGSLKTAYRNAKATAGITRRLPPYSFRHSFASTLLSRNSDLKSTSQLLGHAHIATTTTTYQHTDTPLHRETINRLPTLKAPGNTLPKKTNADSDESA